MPDEAYDRNGCYSGSAVVAEDKMTLFYTGNVKFADGSRTAWQCLAQASDRGEYRKLGPVLALPEGYTGHVRDPKVWRHEGMPGTWCSARRMCRSAARCCCCVPAICATGKRCGEIAGHGVNGLGGCGLYVGVPGPVLARRQRRVLICCPQGLARAAASLPQYRIRPAICSANWIIASAAFGHGELHELDAGFEFYAPQTTLAEDGRRLLIGWMGVPDGQDDA